MCPYDHNNGKQFLGCGCLVLIFWGGVKTPQAMFINLVPRIESKIYIFAAGQWMLPSGRKNNAKHHEHLWPGSPWLWNVVSHLSWVDSKEAKHRRGAKARPAVDTAWEFMWPSPYIPGGEISIAKLCTYSLQTSHWIENHWTKKSKGIYRDSLDHLRFTMLYCETPPPSQFGVVSMFFHGFYIVYV